MSLFCSGDLPNMDYDVAHALGVAPDRYGYNSMYGSAVDPVMEAGMNGNEAGEGAGRSVPELKKPSPGSTQLAPVQIENPDYSIQALMANRQVMTLAAIGAVVYILSR